MKPYRSEWKSVYDGFELEIHIVDHCNMNCRNCNHFSPLAKSFFIEIESFKNQLLLIKQNFPTIQRLLLLGGEPFLHPNLFDLIYIANQIFPNIEINVLTNGTINFTEEQLKDIAFNKDKVNFIITPYPIKEQRKISEELMQNNNLNFHYQYERLIYQQTLVDITGQQKRTQFFSCQKYKLPCFTLKDYKIFICPFSAHIDIFCKANNSPSFIQNNDFLDIRNSSLKDLDHFCFCSKPICKYCKQSDYQLWGLSDFKIEEYLYNSEELYCQDYDTYNRFINNPGYFSLINQDFIDNEYAKNFLNKKNKHFKTGKIDIIIPFYKVTSEQITKLKNSLLKQTFIENCVCCFISDNSPDEKEVFRAFSGSSLNTVFLKTEKRSGPGRARNIGILNTYSPYIFYLDFDDYLIEETILQDLYNNMEQNQYDYINLYKDLLSISFERRKFIIKNKIFFSNLMLHEDELHQDLLSLYSENSKLLKIQAVHYNRDNQISISNQTRHFVALCYKLIKSFYFLDIYKKLYTQNTKLNKEKYFINFQNYISACLINEKDLSKKERELLLKIQKEIEQETYNFDFILNYLNLNNFYENALFDELLHIKECYINE